MTKKSVLILGAGEFMVPAIKTAREMDLRVIAIDRNPNATGFIHADAKEIVDITDTRGAIRVAREYDVDAVVPLNDFGVPTAAFVNEELGFVGISPEVARRSIDKRLMREAWDRAGVPCPGFRIVDTYDAARDAADEIGFPIIVKPPDSMGGSRGMRRVDNIGELKDAFEYGMKHARSEILLIEEYVIGDECSVETITYNKQTHVFAISDKTKLPPPYRVDKSVVYPTKHSMETQDMIADITKKAATALGIDMSPGHMELSVTKKGIRLFEMGARTGGGSVIPAIQVPAAYGINMMKEILKVFIGDKPDFDKRVERGGSDFRFITPNPGTVLSITGLEEALRLKGVVAGGCFVKPGDAVSPVRSGSDRSGYLVTAGTDRENAIEIADMAEGIITIEMDKS